MTLTIIVPVKRLAESKSRLAPVLAEDERQALALRLLRNVLGVVQQAQQRLGAAGVVVTPDPAVLDLAAAYDLTPLPEDPTSLSGYELRITDCAETTLNAALEQATAWAVDRGASAVLILPADLPLLALADVEELWRASQQLYAARAMVIAPDDREQGTNALLVRPPGALRYQFGPHSFQRHSGQAQQSGLAWHVYRSSRLGLDLDLPADLERYLAIEQADHADAAQSMERGSPMTELSAPLRAFLQRPGLLMRLGTLGRDGFPQVTPVWYVFEDDLFYVTTASDRVKTRNMLAHPQVGFAIDSDVKPYQGVSVWGQARLVAEGEAARPLTRRIAARYVPPERLDAMMDTLMQAPRVVFAIEPLRLAAMGSWEQP